jgi:hypothetical protein
VAVLKELVESESDASVAVVKFAAQINVRDSGQRVFTTSLPQ